MHRYMLTLYHLILGGLLMVSTAAAQPLVSSDWLAQHLTDDHIVVLDIRNKIDGGSQAVYEKGHIPGSVYSNYLTAGWRVQQEGVPGMLPPINHLETLIGNLGIGNTSHVIIVPAGVSALDYGSATRVYWTFKVLGHDAVSILNGGYAGWTKSSERTVETGINTPKTVTFKATFRPQLLATRETVSQAAKSGTALIDNRPPAQFTGQKKHPRASRYGSIPDAKNIPQDQFFQATTGEFADTTTLAKLWADQGIVADSDQITYCNTGHWASLGWFAASELLGHANTSMYDGSMTDWAAHSDLPMINSQKSQSK